jgi:hypothetical protein
MAISLAALTVALWTNVRNYRLTRRISEMPGKLQRFQVVRRAEEDGGNFSLIVANGPSDTVLTEVILECTYLIAPRYRLFGGTKVTFFVHRRDFAWFGVSGPALPCRIEPHDQRAWTFPVDRYLLWSQQDMAHSVAFRFIGTTALGHQYKSNKLQVGVVSETFFSRHDTYYGSASENRSSLQEKHSDVYRWIEATRVLAGALDSNTSAPSPRRRSFSWRNLFSRR